MRKASVFIHDRFAGTLGLDQEGEEFSLGFLHLFAEAAIGLEFVEAEGDFPVAQFPYAFGDGLGQVFGVPAEDTQRPAMRGKFLDVEQHDAMAGEDLFDGQEGEVGKMFVIDGVELVFLDEPQQVREFHGDDAMGFEQRFQSCREVP